MRLVEILCSMPTAMTRMSNGELFSKNKLVSLLA